MKLKVYNKKVIDFICENMMTSVFCRGRTSQARSVNAPKNSVIIFSHTKSITYDYYILSNKYRVFAYAIHLTLH
jgi:hypothetical protein